MRTPLSSTPRKQTTTLLGQNPFPTGVAGSFLLISSPGVHRLVAAGDPSRAALMAYPKGDV